MFEDRRDFQIFSDAFGNLGVFQSRIFQRIKNALILNIEEMPNSLQNGDGIGLLFRVLPQPHELLKKLIGVRHIEVTSDHEVAGAPIVLPQKRMAIFNLVFAVRPVAQVREKEFTRECAFALQKRSVAQLRFVEPFKAWHDAAEHILYGT